MNPETTTIFLIESEVLPVILIALAIAVAFVIFLILAKDAIKSIRDMDREEAEEEDYWLFPNAHRRLEKD